MEQPLHIQVHRGYSARALTRLPPFPTPEPLSNAQGPRTRLVPVLVE